VPCESDAIYWKGISYSLLPIAYGVIIFSNFAHSLRRGCLKLVNFPSMPLHPVNYVLEYLEAVISSSKTIGEEKVGGGLEQLKLRM
jgi:hypothetical protein